MHSRTFSSRSANLVVLLEVISLSRIVFACLLPRTLFSPIAGICDCRGLIALAAEVDLLSKFQIASIPEVPTWLIPDF